MRWRALALVELLVAFPIAAEEPGAQAAFEGDGRVVAIDEKSSTVTLDHEAIPGLMPAMRMRFTVQSRAQLRGLKVGDSVRFWVGSRGDEMVIVAIKSIKLPVDLLRVTRVQ